VDVHNGQDPAAAGERYRIITVRGELDHATTALLSFDLNGWEPGEGVLRMVVDLGQITFLDGSALRVLCAAHTRAERDGGWLRLVYAQQRIARLLSATSLDIRFPRHATVADASAGRTSPPPPTAQPHGI
jgi:anti-anti-sigma factor